jgi:hypothetical protein
MEGSAPQRLHSNARLLKPKLFGICLLLWWEGRNMEKHAQNLTVFNLAVTHITSVHIPAMKCKKCKLQQSYHLSGRGELDISLNFVMR